MKTSLRPVTLPVSISLGGVWVPLLEASSFRVDNGHSMLSTQEESFLEYRETSPSMRIVGRFVEGWEVTRFIHEMEAGIGDRLRCDAGLGAQWTLAAWKLEAVSIADDRETVTLDFVGLMGPASNPLTVEPSLV